MIIKTIGKFILIVASYRLEAGLLFRALYKSIKDSIAAYSPVKDAVVKYWGIAKGDIIPRDKATLKKEAALEKKAILKKKATLKKKAALKK